MSGVRLNANQARVSFEVLSQELGSTDSERLETLLSLMQGEQILLSAALSALYPDKTQQQAQDRLRVFRRKLADAAEEAGIEFKLEVDTKKKNPPQQRWCWFEGADSREQQVSRFSEEASADVERDVVPPKAKLLFDKPLVTYFTSYAHADDKHAADLMNKLAANFKRSKKFRYHGWSDHQLMVDDDWNVEIHKALAECDMGILMVSLDFLNSRFITEVELPELVVAVDDGVSGPTKKVIPIGLKKVDFNHHDMHGLEQRQLFRLNNQQFYDACRGPKKDEFALELFKQIELALEKHFKAQSPHKQAVLAPQISPAEPAIEGYSFQKAQEDFPDCHVPNQARAASIDNAESLLSKQKQQAQEEGIDAIQYLYDWLIDADAPPFCALLGEYGMGKTTSCKALSQRLITERKHNKKLPLPIYLDLREYSWDERLNFTLESILQHVLDKSWKGGHLRSEITPDDIVSQVQEKNACVIFDGLDEVIVHMPNKVAQDFIRQLWRILPPTKQLPVKQPRAKGKMLVSCRSHFFRTIKEQNAYFTGEQRDGIKAKDYQALVLLPFNETQIETYLNNVLPDADVEGVLALIRSVHNLPEMAERPYTLSLMAQYIPEIEQRRLSGEQIYGVTLYESMVQHWLMRDEGKHQFSKRHKQLLMEHLAASLWQSKQRQWSVEQLEQWLEQFLDQHRSLARTYGNTKHEVLEEDLRAATFIVRPDEQHFRFAHSSLQEFFHACYLHRALKEGRRAAWCMESPSDETWTFLSQLVMTKAQDTTTCEQQLSDWLQQYQSISSENAFRFWLMLWQQGLNPLRPAQMDLTGADLWRWQFKGTEERLLNLSNCRFNAAELSQSVFEYVNLNGVDFSQAKLWQAQLLNCELDDIKANKTNFDSATVRLCRVHHVDLSTADLGRVHWLRNKTAHLHWPDVMPAEFQQAPNLDLGALTSKMKARIYVGHSGEIASCGFSPDGRQVLSGGCDGQLKLWQVTSGREVQRFEHGGWITSCGFSADGRQVLSGGRDGQLKLWDVASGCEVQYFRHGVGISNCGFSPDGRDILSGGYDGQLRVWQVASGLEVQRFKHGGGVSSCGFSPDGRQVLSGGIDDQLKLWDVVSGREVQRFKHGGASFKHGGGISSCGFSRDGRQVLSGGHDGKLRLWEVASGREVQSLKHGAGISSCWFSPDGTQLLSGGYDGQLKLWEVASGREVQCFAHGIGISSCGFSPNGMQVLSCGYDGELRLWQVASGRKVQCFVHGVGIRSCELSPDGRQVLSVGNDRQLRLWQVASGREVQCFEHGGGVRSCEFSPDGMQLLSGGHDGHLRLWDVASGHEVQRFEHGGGISSCEFSPDGLHLLSGGYNGELRLWDVASGQEVQRFEHGGAGIISCGFSPDGLHVLSGGRGGYLRLWQVASGHEVQCLKHGGVVISCGFSPDSLQVLSAGNDRLLRLWQVASGREVQCFEHGGGISSCEFSPDGLQLLSGGDDGQLRLWDVGSGREIRRFENGAEITSCGFSPDGLTLLSGGVGALLKMWDAQTGKLLKTFGHLPNGQAASIDEQTGRMLYASEGAWPWLGYYDYAPDGSGARRFPAEIFGPLPGVGPDRASVNGGNN